MPPESSPDAVFEQLSPTQYKVEVTVPPETFERKLDEAYSVLSKSATVPGFRPGHAPRGLLNRLFDRSKIIHEATDEIVEATFWPVITARELTVVGHPKIDHGEWKEGEQFHYTATIEVIPPLPEIDYEAIEITLPQREVTDEIMEDELHNLRLRLGMKTGVTDRPTQDGDLVTVELDGQVPDVKIETIDGETPWTMKDETNVELGRGKALPGLENALKRMVIEEIKDFDLELPPDFPDPRVRGRILKAKARLKAIAVPEIPELTPEFIKEKFGSSGVEDLDELKRRVTEEVEKAFRQVDEREEVEQLETWFARSLDFPLPQVLVRMEFANILDRALTELHQKGMDVDELMKPDNRKGLGIRKRAWFQAQRLTRINIVLGEIARREGIKASDEDVANYVMMMAYRQRITEKDLKTLLNDAEFIENTRHDILRRQVTNFLLSKLKPERVEISKFRELAESVREEGAVIERKAVEHMEDPLEILKRAAASAETMPAEEHTPDEHAEEPAAADTAPDSQEQVEK